MEYTMIINGDCLEKLKDLQTNSIDAIVTDPPYGLKFMGKKWDYDVPSVEIWQECLRVLKPGGYLLSFAGTRTQHRMAARIEDAGFEIRDMIAWVYGSGFPKSLNIGKAVDKIQGNEREDLGVRDGATGKRVSKVYGERPCLNNPDYQPRQTKGTSPWEGWGTALKPALEPITVARKPIEGTVAENCLKWGVGGINIDESRVGFDNDKDIETYDNNRRGSTERSKLEVGDRITADKTYDGGWKKQNETPELPLGRFPANLIHDNSEEVRECFPETKSIKSNRGGARNDGTTVFNKVPQNIEMNYECGFNDSGNASRFFKSIIYQAKSSKSDRNSGGVVKNIHPTCKPTALMEYLIKMVTPKGGTVLDPFMGSGSTGIACKKLGREFIGIELEPDYVEIAKARIDGYIVEPEQEALL
jgi:DNA modification methylase